jgi:hypothetical protein
LHLSKVGDPDPTAGLASLRGDAAELRWRVEVVERDS